MFVLTLANVEKMYVTYVKNNNSKNSIESAYRPHHILSYANACYKIHIFRKKISLGQYSLSSLPFSLVFLTSAQKPETEHRLPKTQNANI